MKRIFAIVLAVLITTASYASDPSAYLYGGAKSQYVLGSGAVASDKPVAQGGVTFTFKSGAYVDFWGSVPTTAGRNADYGRETDVTAGWKGVVADKVKLEGALAHYNLYPVGKLNNMDIWSIFGEISAKKGWAIGSSELFPFVKLELLESAGRNVDWASVFHVGARHTYPVSDRFSLAQQAKEVFVDNLPGLSRGHYFSYKMAVDYKISGKATVSPSLELMRPQGLDGGRKSENVVGFMFGYQL